MIKPGARTLYELIIENGDQRILLSYTDRQTRRMLYTILCQHRDRLRTLTGVIDVAFAKRASDGATIGEWRVRWSGRTQREAYTTGRLQWIGDKQL